MLSNEENSTGLDLGSLQSSREGLEAFMKNHTYECEIPYKRRK